MKKIEWCKWLKNEIIGVLSKEALEKLKNIVEKHLDVIARIILTAKNLSRYDNHSSRIWVHSDKPIYMELILSTETDEYLSIHIGSLNITVQPTYNKNGEFSNVKITKSDIGRVHIWDVEKMKTIITNEKLIEKTLEELLIELCNNLYEIMKKVHKDVNNELNEVKTKLGNELFNEMLSRISISKL